MPQDVITLKYDHERQRLAFDTNFSRPLTLKQVLSLLNNGVLLVMNQALIPFEKDTPEYEAAKAKIYDEVNLQMSAVLEKFAPEYELRPGLTEEALLKYENEVIEDEMSQMPSPAPESR
jgi:hypothetical protein